MFQIVLSGFVAIHWIYCLSLVHEVAVQGTFLRSFDKLFPDVKKIVTKTCYAHKYNNVTEHDMSCEDEDKTLIHAANFGASCIKKLKNRKGEAYFIDTIFWYAKGDDYLSLSILRSYEVIIPMHCSVFGRSHESNVMIDGLNKDRYIVMAWANNITSRLFVLFVKDSCGRGYGHGMYFHKPLYKLTNNLITAVMIHPIQNTIAYATIKKNDDNTQQHEIHIVENAYPEEYSYFTSIFSNKRIEKSSIDYCLPVSCEIKKITFFGGNTYIFLTLAGRLGMFWLAKDEKGQSIIQWSLKNHTSIFIDFTPDATRRTKNGFTPYWAFLNDQGELFECDFLAQSIKPTLNFIKKVPTPNEGECFDKVYFNNKKCGVLYKNTDKEVKTSYTKLMLYS